MPVVWDMGNKARGLIEDFHGLAATFFESG